MIYRIFSKSSITFLAFLLSLALSLPFKAHSSDKMLVLFPMAMYADQSKSYLKQGIKIMLMSRLSGGGIDVISGEALEPLLDGKEKDGVISKKRAEDIARRLKADYAVFGSITAVGDGYSLDLSLIELIKDKSRLTRVSEAADGNQFIPKMADVAYQIRAIIEGKEIPTQKMAGRVGVLPEGETTKGLFSRSQQDKQGPMVEKGLLFKPTREAQGLEPTGRISLNMSVMAFDMGDLDGDGEAELVFLDHKRLFIYSKREGTFVLRDSLKSALGEDLLKVSVGDVNNNGRAEIYLMSCYGSRARTSVYEWAGGFKRLYRRTGHIQAVRYPGGGKSLLFFQGTKMNEFFSGRIYYMNYDQGGKLTKGEKLPKLEGIQFYTLALFDINKDGKTEFLGLGKGSTLHAWDKQGKLLSRSGKKVGGTNNAIRVGLRDEPGGLEPRIAFNSRLLVTDVDGDGNNEVLAIKNIPLIGHTVEFKVFKESVLIAYRIDGMRFIPAWTTKDINYCLTDMQAEGKTLFLAAQKGKVSDLTKGSSRIMWFD